MKQTDFRDVPDELWERIEPLLAPFKRKRSGGSKPLAQRTVLAGILCKCRTGCQWTMLPACYGSKSTVHETSSDGTKLVSWRRFFASFLLNMGKRSASTPNGRLWTAPCCKPRRALKKSATEGLGRNPTDRGRSGGKIHLHVDGQGIPLGVTVTGANVHDSRLIEATLKNSREMGGWFLGSTVRHLCLDKGYDYPRVSEEVYVNGFAGVYPLEKIILCKFYTGPSLRHLQSCGAFFRYPADTSISSPEIIHGYLSSQEKTHRKIGLLYWL